jgi:hypothetical protein
MDSNSKIFTTTVFGNSSSYTREELAALQTQTQETYLLQSGIANMRAKLPKVPSNQGIAKDKNNG